MIIASFTTIPLALFSLLFAYVSHHTMLSRCCNLTTLPLPFPLSFASLDTHGNGIAESSWLTDYYNNTVAGADDASADDGIDLKWEFDEERGRYYVSFPDDQ